MTVHSIRHFTIYKLFFYTERGLKNINRLWLIMGFFF